jgi:hypothetical protein
MEATRYPMDFEALQKGDVISSATIERITTVNPRDYRAWQIAVLNLQSIVTRELRKLDRDWVVCQKGNDLRILTDLEAKAYNARAQRAAIRKFAVSHRKNMAVDTSDFTAEERAEHHRQLAIGSRQLVAVRQARREVVRELSATPKPMRIAQ